MSVDNIQENSMDEMMEKIEESMKTIHNGEIVKGKVISVTDNEVIVNIGYLSDGIITKEELSNDENINPRDIIKENDEIYVYVIKVNDGEGNVLLSKKRADSVKVWDEIEEALEKSTTFNVEVKEIVKGGAIAYIQGVRAFIPASHLSYSYVENINDFIGKNLEVKVIELDKHKKKVVLSRKEVEKVEIESKKEKVLSNLKKGEKRNGVVSRLTKFGAFVDLGGIDGLIHISELSWKRVKHPSEVVSVGDNVNVYVLDFDKAKGRISLGLKDVEKNPWANIANKYKINDILDGKVIRLAEFGAFVELEPGVDGLVHISEISEDRVVKTADVLNVGEKVKVKILDIKEDKKKMSLSIKEAKERVVEDFSKYNNDEEEQMATIGDLFKDKLKGFKLD